MECLKVPATSTWCLAHNLTRGYLSDDAINQRFEIVFSHCRTSESPGKSEKILMLRSHQQIVHTSYSPSVVPNQQCQHWLVTRSCTTCDVFPRRGRRPAPEYTAYTCWPFTSDILSKAHLYLLAPPPKILSWEYQPPGHCLKSLY